MSREYRGEKIVIYPQYIDGRKKRSEGRRLSLKYTVPNPRVEEIVKAAEELGLNPVIEDAKYPREWWSSDKRIVVDKKGSKLNTLKMISSKIRELRGIKDCSIHYDT